ncbi:hypothetical protein EMCRGX_G029712 [Ephydatia muelleri]
MPLRKEVKADTACITRYFQSQESLRAENSRKRASEDAIQESPCAQRADLRPESREITPEQQYRIEKNKLEAESKLLCKKFGADSLGATWIAALLPEFKKPYMEELVSFIAEERAQHTVYPPAKDVFTWTTLCSIDEVKVVILGQDPYHGPKQAHGLCFSVLPGVTAPPSLLNIFKELSNDIEGFKVPNHGYLVGWAMQGVLLLNACLTGWEKLTDAVIHWINDHNSNVVFLLWGTDAQKKASFINEARHLVLKTVHPSPLSVYRGFFGCKHFSQANQYLVRHGRVPVDWSHLPG